MSHGAKVLFCNILCNISHMVGCYDTIKLSDQSTHPAPPKMCDVILSLISIASGLCELCCRNHCTQRRLNSIKCRAADVWLDSSRLSNLLLSKAYFSPLSSCCRDRKSLWHLSVYIANINTRGHTDTPTDLYGISSVASLGKHCHQPASFCLCSTSSGQHLPVQAEEGYFYHSAVHSALERGQ